jgi:hypothetical protein
MEYILSKRAVCRFNKNRSNKAVNTNRVVEKRVNSKSNCDVTVSSAVFKGALDPVFSDKSLGIFRLTS